MEAPMENTSHLSIPLILVSAYDVASANVLISKIINSNTQDKSEHENSNETQSSIWKIENKYYKAEVELYPVADNDTLPLSLADRLEAHIIYISEDEGDEAASERAEGRWARAGGVGVCDERVAVHLLVSAPAAPPALAAWARRRRYEHVPLSAADDDDDADVCGVERVRDALHAHTWRGLRRVDAGDARAAEGADGEGGEGWEEAFAAALGALRAGREGAARLPAAARRREAERHMLALLRAVGVDMHSL